MQEPTQLGRYKIVRRLGRGGMGVVYLASVSGPAGYQRDVVIKRLLPRFVETPELVAMFRDEARLTARLQHGNIAQVVDFGEAEGQHFLVLEYVHGVTLREMLCALHARGERLPDTVVAYVASEVARALDYAHRKRDEDGAPLRIVHRDVCPNNILVSFEGQVKLTDFGIAKARNQLRRTEAGMVKGKLCYLAPETLEQGEASPASDLFGLGAVMFELLTGEVAFRGKNDAMTMLKVMECNAPPPSQRTPGVSPLLDRIVGELVARDPSDRPERGLEVVRELAPLCYGNTPPAVVVLSNMLRQLFDATAGGDEDNRATQPSPTATTAVHGLEPGSVLVVVRSRTIRRLIQAALDVYPQVAAMSYGDALALAFQGIPRAIICERILDGATGLDLCRELRARRELATTPFIMLSTDTSEEAAAAAEEAGVDVLLPKAFRPEELRASVDAIIAQSDSDEDHGGPIRRG